MDLAHILRDLWRRRVWVVAVAVLAVTVAVMTTFRVSLLPPSIEKKNLQVGAASTQLLIDSPRSPVADIGRDFEAAEDRATVFAPLMSSTPVKMKIARYLGIPADMIITGSVSTESNEPAPEKRANQIAEEDGLYRLRVTSPAETPLLAITTQGPSAAEAVKLANASAKGLADYVEELQSEQAVPPKRRVKVTQLGDAAGGVIAEGTSAMIGLLTFVALFVGGCLFLLFVANVSAAWRRADYAERTELEPYFETNGNGHHFDPHAAKAATSEPMSGPRAS